MGARQDARPIRYGGCAGSVGVVIKFTPSEEKNQLLAPSRGPIIMLDHVSGIADKRAQR